MTGRAGIGKSTLLQYIAYCWSLDGSQAVPEHIKPLWQEQYTWVIWLPLKLLHREECVGGGKKATSYQRIAYFIQKVCGLEQLEAAEDSNFTKSLAKLLRQHEARMLLLVDSFDEVAYWVNTDCLQGQLLRALFAWKGPMIITTRRYAKSQLPLAWKPDRWIENEGFFDVESLEAVPASQLLLAILDEEPRFNEKVRQDFKALSGIAKTNLWQNWLQAIISNRQLQSASVREQFYLFLASLVEIPGCLAGVLFALKNEDMMHQHSSLLECLLTPQNLRVLLKEYQQVIDSHADSGLTVREYVDLIQWLLQRPRIRAVLDSDHIILYEETVYHRIRLDAEKIRQLQPPNLLRSQADISMPDCQATLFAAPKQDLDPDPKEPPSRFAHLYCQLI